MQNDELKLGIEFLMHEPLITIHIHAVCATVPKTEIAYNYHFFITLQHV